MRLKLKTAPASEPISLEEAKLHLKVDGGADNALITALIITTRQLAEKETHRKFITQTWLMVRDKFKEVIEIPDPPLQSVTSIKAIEGYGSYVDDDSNSGQPILSLAATADFAVGDRVIIGRGGSREEELVVLTVQADASITLTTNLVLAHTATQGDRAEKYELVDKGKYNVDAAENSYGRIRSTSWPAHRGFDSIILEYILGYGDEAADLPTALKEGMFVMIAHMYENRGGEGAVKARVHALEEARILFAPYKVMRI